MLNRLAHGTRKHHRRRVLLRLHLLPWRRAALALLLLLLLLLRLLRLLLLVLLVLLLDTERIGDVWIRRSRRAIGDISVYRVRRRKEMLRISTLRLLRRIGLGLIRRRGMRSGRLLVLLVWVTARLEATVSAQTSLRKIQGGVRVGARRPQSRHGGALYTSSNILSFLDLIICVGFFCAEGKAWLGGFNPTPSSGLSGHGQTRTGVVEVGGAV